MRSEAYFDEAFKRADADREEAVIFLSHIIPKEDKIQIRWKIENDPEFAAREHMILGMKVRNAVRAGGFFYDPHLMDGIWSSWLRQAVCLPKNKMILTDPIKARIKKYEERQRLENPPVCPEVEAGQLSKIIRQLEDHYRIEMPVIRIKYSDRIESSFLLTPPSYDLDELDFVKADRESSLRSRGLGEDELKDIDWYEYNIFLSRRHPKQYVGLYGSAWHELAHVAASIIGIKDRVLNESFAIANEFKGLLHAAKEGLFSQDEVTDLVEHLVKCAKYETLDAGLFAKLSQMGLRGISNDDKTPYHYSALDAIKEHNPDLKFRNRSLDELIIELDRTIEDVLKAWRRRKLSSKLPFIIIPSVVVGGFIVFIIIVSLFL